MIDDCQHFFGIFRSFSFNRKKLKVFQIGVYQFVILTHHFAGKQSAGNQSVHGGFQGAARICLTSVLDSRNFVEYKWQCTYKHSVNKINETDNSWHYTISKLWSLNCCWHEWTQIYCCRQCPWHFSCIECPRNCRFDEFPRNCSCDEKTNNCCSIKRPRESVKASYSNSRKYTNKMFYSEYLLTFSYELKRWSILVQIITLRS